MAHSGAPMPASPSAWISVTLSARPRGERRIAGARLLGLGHQGHDPGQVADVAELGAQPGGQRLAIGVRLVQGQRQHRGTVPGERGLDVGLAFAVSRGRGGGDKEPGAVEPAGGNVGHRPPDGAVAPGVHGRPVELAVPPAGQGREQ